MQKETNTKILEIELITSSKKPYSTPILQVHGKLNRLTQGSGGNGNDGGGNMNMASDRKLKENIIRIGTHPLGVGLYLFNYKKEFKVITKQKRQFGVMADEVEKVLPHAVSIGKNGYKQVDYSQLNIQLN